MTYLMSSAIDILSKFPFFTARNLAQVTSNIMSMSPVMGNITCLMTRYMYG